MLLARNSGHHRKLNCYNLKGKGLDAAKRRLSKII